MLNHLKVSAIAPLLAIVAMFTTPSHADVCDDAGKVGWMLDHLQGMCPGHRLTVAGRRVMSAMAGLATLSGGEACLDRGRVMMQKYFSERLSDDVSNPGKSQRPLCDLIVVEVENLRAARRYPPLVETSP